MGGRGSCRRTRSLRCVPCYNENWSKRMRGLPYNGWESVELISEKGAGYLCKCRVCGHEYVSNSSAARRAFDSLQRKVANNG